MEITTQKQWEINQKAIGKTIEIIENIESTFSNNKDGYFPAEKCTKVFIDNDDYSLYDLDKVTELYLPKWNDVKYSIISSKNMVVFKFYF